MHGSSLCLLLILKDDARCRLGALQREVEELTGERDSAQSRLTQLQNTLQEYQEGQTLLLFVEVVSEKPSPKHKMITKPSLTCVNVCDCREARAGRASDHRSDFAPAAGGGGEERRPREEGSHRQGEGFRTNAAGL